MLHAKHMACKIKHYYSKCLSW